MRQPFAQISLLDLGLLRQLFAFNGSFRVKGSVKAQNITHTNEWHAGGTPEVAEHLADELVQTFFIHDAYPYI